MLGAHKALVWCYLPWEQLLLLICLDKTSFTAREGVGRENLQNSSASDQSFFTELNKRPASLPAPAIYSGSSGYPG